MDTIIIKGTGDMEVTDMIELLLDNEILEENDILKFPNCMLIFVKKWFDNEKVYEIVTALKMVTDEFIDVELGDETFQITAVKDYEDRTDLELEIKMHYAKLADWEWMQRYIQIEHDYNLNITQVKNNEDHMDIEPEINLNHTKLAELEWMQRYVQNENEYELNVMIGCFENLSLSEHEIIDCI